MMSLAQTLVERPDGAASTATLPGHVVMLTNFIPPYRLPVYRELARRVEKLTILLSTPMEPNRNWRAEWSGLDVRVQRTFTVRRAWRHAAGFRDTLYIHVPVDTLRQLRTLRPDVILSAELGFRSLFSGLYSGYLRRTPLVLWLTLSEHTEQGRGAARYALRRWLLRRAARVVVNGDSGARYVERLGFSRRRVSFVPYTALEGLFEQLPLARSPDAAHRLLYVGQVIERKGLAPFVEALACWTAAHPDRRVEFDVVGSGPCAGSLTDLSLPSNLSIRFLSERSYADLPQCYSACGIFAFPTLADEWGLVVNEALAAGLPVLGSVYSQAVEELCREGQNGWTFRPTSQTDMIDAIDRALSTPADLLEPMRAAARASVQHLTSEFAVERLVQALSAALGPQQGEIDA